MWEGVASEDKDPRKSLHVDEVATARAGPRRGVRRRHGLGHQLQHGVDLDLRAAAHLRVPDRLGKESVWGARHDLPYHVVGSDASGVVLRTGSAVRNWKPGDKVTVHCNHVDDQDPSAHDDSMLAANQRIWGFETNFGGLADLTVVKANQLMPKPKHLTWEEAACNALCNSTSYRMIVSTPVT
jgi:crotonyl-CoA reductase